MICYFTGTGNSRYAAQMLAELTGDTVYNAAKDIKEKNYPKLTSQTPWVFAAPVYGWRLPRVFEEWIKKSGFSGRRQVYFILTCGSDMGNAEKYLRRLCKSKKFEFMGAKAVVMPENYAAMFEVPDEQTSERIRHAAHRGIRQIAAAVSKNEHLTKNKITFSDRFKSAVINPVFYSFCVKSKAFYAKDSCTSCGRCAASCPVNGIEIKNGRPVWTGDCTHCMSCLCGCPAEAIEYGRRSEGKVRYKCPEYKSELPETPSEGKPELMKYSAQFETSAENFDDKGNLLPIRVLEIFQRLADVHGADMGVDFQTMYDRGLLWVITQIKYQVCKDIQPGEMIVGTTWPLPPARLGFEREYLLCDASGDVVIKGTSNWVLIDTVERKLMPTADVYPLGEYCTDKNFEGRIRRLRDFEAGEEKYKICPDESHIDKNGHVNNTKYAGFVVEALGGLAGKTDTLQIDYINEVMCGQPLYISHADADNGVLVKGEDENGKRMFTCSVNYK